MIAEKFLRQIGTEAERPAQPEYLEGAGIAADGGSTGGGKEYGSFAAGGNKF